LDDININNSTGGTVATSASTIDVSIPDLSFQNSTGGTLGFIPGIYPTDSVVTVPNFAIINSDGQSGNTFVYDDIVYTDFSGGSGGSPSGILYRQIIPSMPDVARSIRADDIQGLFLSGYYDRAQNLTPLSVAEIDYTAQQSAVRITPATGTLSTDPVSPTILKDNNAFGNKLRFTDSLGNPSDATVGTNIWAHVDWLNHSFTGAIADYVIDHLTGDGYYIRYLNDGGKYTIDVAGGTGNSWEDWLDYISGFSYSGFSDWVVIDASTDRPHYSKCNPTTTWANNFFISARAPGEIVGQTDNRLSMLTGENAGATLVLFTGINDSSNNDMLVDFPKAGLGGFVGGIVNAFCMRKHY